MGSASQVICVERKLSPPNPDLRTAEDRFLLQNLCVPIHHAFESLVHVGRSQTAEPNNHNARQGRPVLGHEITEIEVVREKNPVFLLGESEDVPILQLLLTSIDEMVGVVATLPKEGDRPRTDAHVGQKSHATSSTFSSASQAAYWRAC